MSARSMTASTSLQFDNTFVRQLGGLYEPWQAAPATAPELLVLNESLALELGLEPQALRSTDGVDMLVGNVVPLGAQPVAMAYAGHQFGGFSPRLGDGRALLLGEVIDLRGDRRDLHLKGSGRTPFARGGDGKAAIGPMLREYLIGEAMQALGIPTTRALAVVSTGEDVVRETLLPGAVLVRVAASHVRVGTFQYAAGHEDPTLLKRLADYAIARHYPGVAEADNPYLVFLEAVLDAQATLIAQWMSVGFIHGVMNTDNMTISGETIDYGPCAFMDTYDPATVFSSIDLGGRYAFGNQPAIAQWNLARLAETLLPLIDDDSDAAISAATDVLTSFPVRFTERWQASMSAKLGLRKPAADPDLVDDLLALLSEQRIDYTSSMRSLSSVVRGDVAALQSHFPEPGRPLAWLARWSVALAAEGRDPLAVAAAMDAVNPVYIPRNHLVEEALAGATLGDLAPMERLTDILLQPFTERAGSERYAEPAPADFEGYQTFCGT